MKNLIFIILITSILNITNAVSDEINCTRFEKISAKYIECTVKNIKIRSKKIKLKATIGAEEIKEQITTNAIKNKKKFDKSAFKEKFIKFKNSKTLTKFMEK